MKVEVNNAQQNEQVDWTKNPQLVVSDSGKIVLVISNQTTAFNSDSFVGIRLDKHSFDNCWSKSTFKPFHGSITLSND